MSCGAWSRDGTVAAVTLVPLPIPRIAIHGGCVTRDMLEVCAASDSLVAYRARSSLATKGTPPLGGDLLFVDELESKFNRRMLRQDLIKTPFAPTGAEVVILDLFGERCGVLRCGASLITDSNLFRQARGEEHLDVHEAFERGSAQHLEQFRVGCEAFRAELATLGLPVVLHSSRWATRFTTDDGPETFDDLDVIERENDLLGLLEEVVRRVIVPDEVITPDKGTMLASPDHRWGLAPYHFVDAYYHGVFDRLLSWWGTRVSDGTGTPA